MSSLLLSSFALAEPVAPSEENPVEGRPADATVRVAGSSESSVEGSPTADDSKHSKESKKTKPSLKDPEDGMLDASAWLDQLYGFVPVPSVITEPALGGIGGGLGLIFFGKRKQDQRIPPNMLGLFGGYTANKSWMVGSGYRGFLDKGRLRVAAIGFYGEPNLDFYLTVPIEGEITARADIQSYGATARVMRKIGKTPLYLGAAVGDRQLHLTLDNDRFAEAIDWFPGFELHQNQAQVHASSEFDTQNNFFSPTQGTYLRFDGGYNFIMGDDAGGFGDLYAVAHQFFDLKRVVLGFRGVGNVILGDAPFYLKPFVSLRGVPLARYQGDYTVTLETEEMIRFTQRFGMVVFGGWGKAFSDDVAFKEATNVWNVGSGFRYLVARAYGLQMGVDIARGPEDFAWYIQFGHAWAGD